MAPLSCKEIFDAMPSRFDAEAAGEWSAVIQFNISGEGGGNWVVEVKDKKPNVYEGTTESPTATVDTDAETYVGIAEGKINGQTAFFTGKLKIQGNMNDVMKMNSVFKR